MAAERDQWAAAGAECIERSTVSPRLNINRMVDPVKFCGSATKLDQFLDALRSKFNSHCHVFPRGVPTQVKYAISLLDAWSNHQHPTLRQMAMTDPLEWAGNTSAESDPCRTSTSFHKRRLWFIGIRTDHTWR